MIKKIKDGFVKMVKSIISYFVKFVKFVIRLIKSFKSTKGIISLIISFVIFVGWALIFLLIGILTNNPWYIGIGTTVVVFWAAPLTPMWVLIIGFALFLQRVVFGEKAIKTKEEIVEELDFKE